MSAAGPLRLSLDVTAVPAAPAGAGRYTLELARALARRDDVDLVLLRPPRRRGRAGRRSATTTAAGPRCSPWPRARVPSAWPGSRPRLGRLVRRCGASVHHGPHYTMPERARVPVVVTVHDCTFFDHPEWHERSKVVRLPPGHPAWPPAGPRRWSA